MRFDAQSAGEYGGTWIPAAAATVTPDSGNYWCRFEVINDITVTAVGSPNADGTHGTQVWKAGSVISGRFTSITTTTASAAGLVWAVYGRPQA